MRLDVREPGVERPRHPHPERFVTGEVLRPHSAHVGVVPLEQAAVQRLLRLEVVVHDRR